MTQTQLFPESEVRHPRVGRVFVFEKISAEALFERTTGVDLSSFVEETIWAGGFRGTPKQREALPAFLCEGLLEALLDDEATAARLANPDAALAAFRTIQARLTAEFLA